jgi:hypothetical protein
MHFCGLGFTATLMLSDHACRSCANLMFLLLIMIPASSSKTSSQDQTPSNNAEPLHCILSQACGSTFYCGIESTKQVLAAGWHMHANHFIGSVIQWCRDEYDIEGSYHSCQLLKKGHLTTPIDLWPTTPICACAVHLIARLALLDCLSSSKWHSLLFLLGAELEDSTISSRSWS